MDTSFSNLADLAKKIFAEIAAMSGDTQGISRPAYSAVETDALDYLEREAKAHGLSTSLDPCRNLYFSLPEDANSEKFVLVGSHVDSVPQGGNYDGLAGVVAGLLCLIRARKSNLRFAKPVKVVALRGEESHWFGPCYVGSKCLTGQLTASELAAPHKLDGQSLESHMRELGVDVERVRAGQPLVDLDSLLAYVELHIEQGPMLVEKRLPAAIVSGIRGNFRHKKIICIGETGHSGAVPRAYRHDPVMALADLLSRLDDSWLTILQKGNDLVLTAGVVTTDPETHSLSRIPGKVTFCLDCRSQNKNALLDMQELLQQEIAQVEAVRKVRFQLDEALFTEPAMMAEGVIDDLKKAMVNVGLEPFVMPSGGGHDAAIFANAGVPTGMVFVRNDKGSHNPEETLELSDFLIGSDIVFNFLIGDVQ